MDLNLTSTDSEGGGAVTDRTVENQELSQSSADGHDPASIGVLLETIQAEIIPRIMVAHRAGAPEATNDAANGTPDSWREAVDKLADLVLSADLDAAGQYVRDLRQRGRSTAELLVHLLGPTARRLGDLWTQDKRSFSDVTIGLGRLQALLWDLSLTARDQDFAATAPPRGRVLITSAPNEQHTFGASMVAEFFRWWGWDVVAGPYRSPESLIEAVRNEDFSVIGLSLSGDRGIEDLTAQIERIRAASANEFVTVMVGGRVFVATPGLVTEVGADGTADSASDAASVASSLVSEKQQSGL